MAELRDHPHPRPLSHCGGRGERGEQRSDTLGQGGCGSRFAMPPVVRLRRKRGTSAGWRRLRLFGVAGVLVVVLGGCSVSPEASRVSGEPGADVGNHGNPIELLAPPNRFDRIYADTPYDGPRIAKPDTSQS